MVGRINIRGMLADAGANNERGYRRIPFHVGGVYQLLEDIKCGQCGGIARYISQGSSH